VVAFTHPTQRGVKKMKRKSHPLALTYLSKEYVFGEYVVGIASRPADDGGRGSAAPSDRASGDWAAVAPKDGGFRAVLADLAGKGHDAATYHRLLRQSLDSGNGATGSAWLAELHSHWPESRFASVAVADVDADSHRISFVVAGHPDPVLRLAGAKAHCAGAPRLGAVGIDESYNWGTAGDVAVTSYPFPPGAYCVLFSDGVLDAGVYNGAPFGEKRLMEAINTAADAADAVRTIIQRVFDHLAGAPPEDDLTVLVIGRRSG
jgi:serine phosphatase RsbU (regulator of sigma subunit)